MKNMFRPLIRPSSIEIKMMREMDERGMRYVFQYKMGRGFYVDFAFPEHKLVVECDGDYWHANPKKYSGKKLSWRQRESVIIDKKRNELVSAAGWSIIRFWESKINEDVKKCVDAIERSIKKSRKA